MKIILCLLLASPLVWAKSTKINFNEALIQDVEKDIKRDDEKFKTDIRRGPASVEVEKLPTVKEESKIDKNVRQIGPDRW